jgi:hypothetical protein
MFHVEQTYNRITDHRSSIIDHRSSISQLLLKQIFKRLMALTTFMVFVCFDSIFIHVMVFAAQKFSRLWSRNHTSGAGPVVEAAGLFVVAFADSILNESFGGTIDEGGIITGKLSLEGGLTDGVLSLKSD